MTYDYRNAVKADVKDFINDLDVGTFALLVQGDEETIDEVRDSVFNDDSTTRNDSGSHTFNTLEAEQHQVGNWELLKEARDELSPDVDLLDKGAEWCDVLIRCYLVDEAFTECLEEITKEKQRR